MGIDIHALRLLCHAKRCGVSFVRTATLGRQGLYISDDDLRNVLKTYGHSLTRSEIRELMRRRDGYAEPILELLGSSHIDSFDASDYERATQVVDFNFAIDNRFKEKYSVVIDCGTLEHVFNFPVAITNCMRMVETGGHFICVSPTNNFAGHGFYQFSIELYFRIFSSANGFRVQRMLVSECNASARWYEVIDPATVGARMDLINATPTFFLMIAEKIAAVEPFAEPPQQSDYVSSWAPGSPSAPRRNLARSVYALLPRPLQAGARRALNTYRKTRRRGNPFDPRFCKRIEL